MIAALRAAARAFRDHYRPTAGSTAIKAYPPPRHLEIERKEPFRKHLGGRWMLEVPAISVDMADRVAMMQYSIRAVLKRIIAARVEDPAMILQAAKLKRQFLDTLIFLLYDLSKGRYVVAPDQRAYQRHLFKIFREDPDEAVRTFDELLDKNSKLESFFFDIPPVDRRTVRRPDRDGWRAIRGRVWREEWGSLLEAPILKVYSIMLCAMEDDLLAQMEEKQRSLEEGLKRGK